ncbi:dihydrofolate synthase/folylpolyglutamate synthase [Nicoletella semolina]|uniref:Dihydrofolate synthase/folylpolyglutamate synthase n=1 Tax=Nicoletella semolina TaxID=271160 RepID=A0A4R2N880_9PAST|nr:bifunctional tetrahydrofolate synthase/dihydrofolate synthase [Nicoletella semolina]MDH2923852.1 bifunctional folylpolyglutamate synthase/dihydrofolate synthase [Nicoletella semolina]TCP17164.1 dihydrofolate synthase/folylpolyglutamate synthase [Nicoletella semolina]
MSIISTPKATDSLEAWLSYLEQSHSKPIDMGLERIRCVAQKMELLKSAPYVITVAGTNGKGSTCKFIEAALLASGIRVGVYSSPHLIHYNERVRIQGKNVSDSALVNVFADIEANKSHSLTYFEVGTLAALALFKQQKVDVAILEVGLGGRLDATNIVDTDFAVITSIDIDHVEFLGDNREQIGREKAGIFRQNCPVVIGEPDCPQSIIDYAKHLNCQLFQHGEHWNYSEQSDRLLWQSEGKSYEMPLPNIPTPNAATALAVLDKLPFSINENSIRQAFVEVKMTGRFQKLSVADFAKFSGNLPLAQVIIDVGHNPHAARYLASQLEKYSSPNRRMYALFSALVDKDLSGIVRPLEALITEWHCIGLEGYRGQSGQAVLDKLHYVLPNATAVAYSTIESAVDTLFQQAQEQDMIMVFGSFYTVANFLQFIQQ